MSLYNELRYLYRLDRLCGRSVIVSAFRAVRDALRPVPF